MRIFGWIVTPSIVKFCLRLCWFLVTFTEDDTYEVSTTRCRLSLTIVELRKRIADQLHIPCAVVQILQHGNYTCCICISLSVCRFVPDPTDARNVIAEVSA